MKNLATTLAWAAAAAFLGGGRDGICPNPLLGPHALFVTNRRHNFVHLVTAIAFVVVALRGETASIRLMQAFGVVSMPPMGFVMLGSWAEGNCCTSSTSTGSTTSCTSAWASPSPRPVGVSRRYTNGRWFDHRRSEQIARAPCHACHACRLGLDGPGDIRPDLRRDRGPLQGAEPAGGPPPDRPPGFPRPASRRRASPRSVPMSEGRSPSS